MAPTTRNGSGGDGGATPAPAASGSSQRQQHKAHEFEFFGPFLGPLGIMLGLPAVCYALVYACNASGCMHLAPKFSIPGFPPGQRLFTWEALAVYVAWFAFQVALHLLLPGQRRQGVVLPNGSRLNYKLNGERVRGAGAGRRRAGQAGVCSEPLLCQLLGWCHPIHPALQLATPPCPPARLLDRRPAEHGDQCGRGALLWLLPRLPQPGVGV